MKQTIENVVKILGQDEVLVTTMEECSELSKECSKVYRNRGNRESLIEKMADVIICLEYLKETFNISEEEIKEYLDLKTYRSKQRIKTNSLSMRKE